VAEIGRVARELDLLYLVDACQSIGQYRLDLDEIGADFLSVTGRKFLRGPRGSGFLAVSDRVLESTMEPLFVDMRGANWTGPTSYERVPDAKRFEDWEFSYALVLGLTEAVRYAVEARTPGLGAALRERLAAIDRVRILDPGRERCAIVTFDVEGHDDPEGLKRAFGERRINSSVAHRSSALLDFDDKGVEWALRLSPHYYNTEQELDDVVAAAEEIVAGL
jgi:selenocysteine lyase/cysteine desulfurase